MVQRRESLRSHDGDPGWQWDEVSPLREEIGTGVKPARYCTKSSRDNG
jgi:hypothetical protein